MMVAILTITARVAGQSGGPYELTWSTLEGGGASTGGPYLVTGVAGQYDAGTMSGGPYEVQGGFAAIGGVVTAVNDPERPAQTPTSLRFYPNPFNPTGTVELRLAKSEHVRITVYDVGGRLVRTLTDERRPQGVHLVSWDGADSSGRQVSSGVYLLVVEAGSFREARKITMLK